MENGNPSIDPATTTQFELYCPLHDQAQLQLQFESVGDVFVHRLSVDSGNDSCRLLESIESPADNGPATPPLQELVNEVHDGRDTLLGVGRSGRSHWSVAFQCSEDGTGVQADYACRMHTPVQIVCLWRVARDCDVTASDGKIIFAANGIDLELEAVDAQWSFNKDHRRLLLTADNHAAERKYPATVQWGWSVRQAG